MNRTRKECLIILILLGAICLKGSSMEEAYEKAPLSVCLDMLADGRNQWSGNIFDKLKTRETLGKAQETKESGEETGFLAKWAGNYAYNSLSEAEQIWYRDMEGILGSMGKDVKLSARGLEAGLDVACIDAVFQCVMIDHPEIFYVDGYSYDQYLKGNDTTAITFSGNYTMGEEEAAARQAAIREAADALLEGAPMGGSDYDKVKYVYDTLVQNTEYDLTAEDNQNIYSVFVNHKSVCQGYAKATQYLLLKMGIECVLVQGTVDTGEAHSWNLVNADGDYYYVDVTWGDASYQMQEDTGGLFMENAVNYDYLCVTTKQLLRTHILGGFLPMPVCTAQKDNYYVQEGALFSQYDEAQLEALFEKARQAQRSDLTIQCEDINCFWEMKRILIDEQKIFDFMESGGERVSYACNEKQLSFMFWTG